MPPPPVWKLYPGELWKNLKYLPPPLINELLNFLPSQRAEIWIFRSKGQFEGLKRAQPRVQSDTLAVGKNSTMKSAKWRRFEDGRGRKKKNSPPPFGRRLYRKVYGCKKSVFRSIRVTKSEVVKESNDIFTLSPRRRARGRRRWDGKRNLGWNSPAATHFQRPPDRVVVKPYFLIFL